MFKKVESWLQEQQKKTKQRLEAKKAEQFYKIVRAGGMFIEMIMKDLAKQENDLNRSQRRRMFKELQKDGKLTPEIVAHYQQRIDMVLYQINMLLNPPKVKQQKNSNCEVRTTPPPGVKSEDSKNVTK